METALAEATLLFERLGEGDRTDLRWSPELPDILYALAFLLTKSDDTTGRALEVARAAYAAISNLQWPSQVIEERSGILASFSYAAWNQCRRGARWTEMRFYEARCEAHVVEQEHARDFLALEPANRSADVNTRFLSDPPVLLAATLALQRLPNSEPRRSASHGRELFEWISRTESDMSPDEVAWFAGQALVAMAGSLRHLGEFSKAEQWLDRADVAAVQARCLALTLQIEYQRLTTMYTRRELGEVLERSSRLVKDLEGSGLDVELGKARFLHASALKDEGNQIALEAFESLLGRPEIIRDPLLLGLSLLHVGDLRGSRGEFESATAFFQEARPLLEGSKTEWALADFDAVVAEKLRDQGCLLAAIDGYRSAIKRYRDIGCSARESYLRVLLAETLIADGQQAEATAELMAALPAIERESLEREGIVAIALLREAMTRSKGDQEDLRALRVQLDLFRKGAV